MVFIHGGGYTAGTGNSYQGEILSGLHDVVVVTFNYRLSAFGFLTTGDSELPGNYGLWDQHLAIKWVHNNIVDYGGDPNSVTIFGESAGGSAVMYQMLSPQNDATLFQRVISQSAYTVFMANVERDPLTSTQLFVNSLGCNVSHELVDCMRTKSVSEIMNATATFAFDINLFSPISDDEFLMKGVGNLYSNFYKNRTSPDIKNVIGNFLDYDLFGGWNDQEGLFSVALYLPIYSSIISGTSSIDEGISEELLNGILSSFPFSALQNPRLSQFSLNLLRDFYLQDPLSIASRLGRSEADERIEVFMRLSG